MTSEQDRRTFERLIDFARDQVLPMTTKPSHVLAAGEFWEAIESWIQGTPEKVQVNVSIGIYCWDGEPDDYVEHLHADARVNDGEVEVTTLRRTYCKDMGSDHHSETLGRLLKGGRSEFRDFDA
jgi:hypothetical protein